MQRTLCGAPRGLRMAGHSVVLAPALGFFLLTAHLAWPALYKCTDPSGATIFTDSPAQEKNCRIVSQNQPLAEVQPQRPPEGAQPPDASPKNEPERTVEAAGTESSGEVRVPLLRAGRSMVVQARLNGTRNARFIVDTGADITMLSHELARDLGIVPTASSPTVTLNTAGGTVRVDLVRVDSIEVGEAEVRNIAAAVHDLPDAPSGVDGLLGLTFLDRFLVTLDSAKGELRLRRR